MSPASIEGECRRCSGSRSIPNPYIPLNARGRPTGPARDLREPDGYTCLRCRRVLAGGRVQDPIAIDARRDACLVASKARQIATTSERYDPGAIPATQEDSAYDLP